MRVAAPAVTDHVTGAWLDGSPPRSVTSATNADVASTPGLTFWLLPAMIFMIAGGPELTVNAVPPTLTISKIGHFSNQRRCRFDARIDVLVVTRDDLHDSRRSGVDRKRCPPEVHEVAADDDRICPRTELAAKYRGASRNTGGIRKDGARLLAWLGSTVYTRLAGCPG